MTRSSRPITAISSPLNLTRSATNSASKDPSTPSSTKPPKARLDPRPRTLHPLRRQRVVPDGTVRDEFRLARGWWEAKDTSDNLAAEIKKKIKAGYPTRNTIFEDTQTAVLFQDGAETRFTLGIRQTSPSCSFTSSPLRRIRRARIPPRDGRVQEPHPRSRRALANISRKPTKQTSPSGRFAEFFALCRTSLNPDLSAATVDEMLVQHLLTERLMRKIFDNPEFTHRNVIAARSKGHRSPALRSFYRDEFLKRLDPFYKAIEKAGAGLATSPKSRTFSTPSTNSFSRDSRSTSRTRTASSTRRTKSSTTCATPWRRC